MYFTIKSCGSLAIYRGLKLKTFRIRQRKITDLWRYQKKHRERSVGQIKDENEIAETWI